MPFQPDDELILRLPAIEVQNLLNILQKSVELQQMVMIFQRFAFPAEITTMLHTKINTQAMSQLPQAQAPNVTTMRGDGVSDPMSAAE